MPPIDEDPEEIVACVLKALEAPFGSLGDLDQGEKALLRLTRPAFSELFGRLGLLRDPKTAWAVMLLIFGTRLTKKLARKVRADRAKRKEAEPDEPEVAPSADGPARGATGLPRRLSWGDPDAPPNPQES